MRLTALAGLFAFAMIFATSSPTVNAEALDIIETNIPAQTTTIGAVLAVTELPLIDDTAAVPVKKESKVHLVGPNETLSLIADQNQTTWKRIYDKNEQIADPGILKVGDKVAIPLPEETLKDRPLPVPPVQPVAEPKVKIQPKQSTNKRPAANFSRSISRVSSAGNSYTPGYCTWYAKNMRPDMPNNLGNANTWVSRAAAQGMATGSTPRAGAIGQQGMHVVYVQRVNSGGTVTISEMNYHGLYVVSSRTVAASTFTYIY